MILYSKVLAGGMRSFYARDSKKYGEKKRRTNESGKGKVEKEIETEDGTSKVMKIYGGLRQCKRK